MVETVKHYIRYVDIPLDISYKDREPIRIEKQAFKLSLEDEILPYLKIQYFQKNKLPKLLRPQHLK